MSLAHSSVPGVLGYILIAVAKISIITSGHISTNPRVWREADTLASAGHQVTVIGVCYDSEQCELDRQMLRTRLWRYVPAADLRRSSLWHRSRARVARLLLKQNVQDPYALGYAVHKVLRCAIEQKADLTICHLEVAMWVGAKVHEHGFRVGVDIEDWYSEAGRTSTTHARFLRGLERAILSRSVHATTTSHAMADAISVKYGCRKPKVIYNSVPSWIGNRCADKAGPVRLIWFSQRLGRDRGLQDVFGALPMLVGDWRLELRAEVSVELCRWVESQIPPELRSRVHIEPTVPPEKLSSIVARCDIGLAPESPSCRNKALTASNKMLQYLQSGLLVAASDTPGQREILNSFPIGGRLYSAGDSSSLASVLNSWIIYPEKIREGSSTIYSQANELFGYERQAQVLLASVDEALGT